jgi:MerR family transcriptional regulator, light-induced transcriptional regulator
MALDTKPTHVSTESVAKALGVSVSTVKRWVDEGVLPAQKTAGGHRKLLVSDVLELARRGDLPHADLSRLTNSGRQVVDFSAFADELYRALVSGDGRQIRALIVGAYRRGAALEALADQAIAPAMTKIGREWAAGRIDVMEEHRASQLCAGVLYELKALLEERAVKDRPRAIGGAPEGDESLLPTLLAQMILLDAGWEAINLGPNTPFASFGKALADLRPQLIWLSVSHMADEENFLGRYRKFYQQADKAGVAVAIGGHALAEPIRSRIPYTTYGDGLTHLAAFARSLHPRPSLPRRGRPKK